MVDFAPAPTAAPTVTFVKGAVDTLNPTAQNLLGRVVNVFGGVRDNAEAHFGAANAASAPSPSSPTPAFKARL